VHNTKTKVDILGLTQLKRNNTDDNATLRQRQIKWLEHVY